MSTRQEDLNNLKSIYTALNNIENAQQSIAEKEKHIEKQQSRSIKYDPPSFSREHEAEARANIESKKKKSLTVVSIICAILTLPCLGYEIYVLIKEEGLFAILDVLIWSASYAAILFFAITFPRYGWFISAGCHLALAGFWCIGSDWIFVRPHLISAICFAAVGIIWIVCSLIYRPIRKKKERKIMMLAKQEDDVAYEKYKKDKEAAHTAFVKKQDNLRTEVAAIVAQDKEAIEKLKVSINENRYIVANNHCLADQDKNLHTVRTLINYFERGKADSIKEAINLFDLESHRNTVAEIARIDREMALDRMEREQRQHNEAMLNSAKRMEEEQREHNEKIRRELDEMKKDL